MTEEETVEILEVGQIEELPKDTMGVYVIDTETAHYLMDFDARRVTRFPRKRSLIDQHPMNVDTLEVHHLRKDYDAVELLDFQTIYLGQPMTLTLHEVNDDPSIATMRMTTIVRGIRKVDLSDKDAND